MNLDTAVVEKINQALPDSIENITDFRGERTLLIKKDKLKAVCMLLRDHADLQYNFLSDICADDFFPETPRFAVNYHLYSISKNHRLRLRVEVEDPENGPETLDSVWPIATWLEMEVWDLMGVRTKGNTSLRRLFLPEDWQGHPLRKDYPLGYEEVQFTFNREAIDALKPYARD